MESNNLERRVRLLEQELAALRVWSEERTKVLEEHLRRNEQMHSEINLHLARIEGDIHSLQRLMDKTSTKVAMLVVGASIVVSSIMAVIHYAVV